MTHAVPESWIFYSRDSLHVDVYDSAYDAGDDVPMLIEQARAVDGPVLELACGTGRALWPVADAGFECVGIDISDAMLRRAQAKRSGYAEASSRVTFHRGDMVAFDLPQRFGLVYITFRSFQALLTPEDQKRCLRRIHRHLRDGGRLVLDLFDPRLEMCDPAYREPANESRPRPHPDGGTVTNMALERVNDPVRQVLRQLWRFTHRDDAGKVLREEHEHLELRWTYRYEMRHLLELCGFDVLAEYSDFQGSPPAYGKEQVWVAGKALARRHPGAQESKP